MISEMPLNGASQGTIYQGYTAGNLKLSLHPNTAFSDYLITFAAYEPVQ